MDHNEPLGPDTTEAIEQFHKRARQLNKDEFAKWNRQLAEDGQAAIDVSTLCGVNSQLGRSRPDEYPTDDLTPRQLPTLALTDDELDAYESAFTPQSSIGGSLAAFAQGVPGGYGFVGRTRTYSRPSRYQRGPLRVLGRCNEQGCARRVEGYRSTRKYCPEHSTEAARKRRYRRSVPGNSRLVSRG